MNKSYTRYLSDKAIKDLQLLIGSNLYHIFSPKIKVEYDDVIVARYLSISIGDTWFNFSNLWKETDKDFTFHEFNLEISDAPLNIPYDKESRSIYDPCSILLPTSDFKVKNIEIYTLDDTAEADQEEIIYDYAVLFTYDSGYQFCISVFEESIADELMLIRDKEMIKKRLKEAKVRIRL